MTRVHFKPVMAAALMVSSWAAQAVTVTVLPSDLSWGTTGNSGGGSSAITDTAAHLGNGSIELHGDRTRFQTAPADFGLLNDVLSLSYDWSIAVGSSSNLGADYTPALRLLVKDGNQFSELIWEGAYNGTYGNTTKGQWYTSGANDKFHRWVTGVGGTEDGGALVTQSIANWASGASSGGSQWYSDSAVVWSISVGAGSSVGGGYQAFADNVTYTTTSGSVSYNFEIPTAPIPEPASLALFAAGLAAVSSVVRRRKA